MKNLLEKFLSLPPIYGFVSLLVYALYSIPIGLSFVPSASILWLSSKWLLQDFDILNIIIFCLITAFSIYIFFISALIFLGITGRLLTLGIKPGRYEIGSATFIRWLINGGLHTTAMFLVLPFMVGSGWIKLYFRLLGCKMGKNVFLNSKGLQDAYLLELGDDVIIGGEVDITCHIFEGRHLILNKIIIGDNTLIGFRSYVMPGAEIGKKSVIGCYSVIRKDRKFHDNSMIISIPGLPIRKVAKFVSDNEK